MCPNHQKQLRNTELVVLYFYCLYGLVLQGHGVLKGNEGEKPQRDPVVGGGILEPVHYMRYNFFSLQAHLNRIYQV